MTSIAIFGTGTIAKLVWHYFEYETQYTVSNFIVEDKFLLKIYFVVFLSLLTVFL